MEIKLEMYTHGLELHEDGIWRRGTPVTVSYPEEGNAECFKLEDKSFWFAHRNLCIIQLLKSFPVPGPLFDIGGGNGFVAKAIQDQGYEVVLVEPGLVGAQNSRLRGVRHVINDFDKSLFRQASLPSIGIFDVLEHIEDDMSFLHTLRDSLVSKGRLYLTVPAFKGLWSSEDIIAGHYRRYTLKEITKRLQLAGFKIDFGSYFFRPLPIPIFLARALPFKLGLRSSPSQEATEREHGDGGLGTTILKKLLYPELKRIAEKKPMHFGGSCIVAASLR